MAPQDPCKIIKTPNPCELGLKVRLKDSLLANNPQIFPTQTGVIPYSTFNAQAKGILKLDQSYLKGFGDYCYTYMEEEGFDQEGFGWISLYFAKAKTPAERNTAFKTFWAKRPMTFDATLDGVAVFSTTIDSQQVWFPKYFGLAEYSGPCLFKIEQFLSEIPWNSNSFQATAPQPQTVDAWVISPTGQRVHIFQPRVLHPKLQFDSPGSTGNLVFKTGLIPSLGGNSGTQYTFSATQPAGREFYVYSDSQDPVAGQYLREKATIYPPTVSQPLR